MIKPKAPKYTCSACKQQFDTCKAFDAHRKGNYQDRGRNRYCINLDTKQVVWMHPSKVKAIS